MYCSRLNNKNIDSMKNIYVLLCLEEKEAGSHRILSSAWQAVSRGKEKKILSKF
jgi:hypothetical protein